MTAKIRELIVGERKNAARNEAALQGASAGHESVRMSAHCGRLPSLPYTCPLMMFYATTVQLVSRLWKLNLELREWSLLFLEYKTKPRKARNRADQELTLRNTRAR